MQFVPLSSLLLVPPLTSSVWIRNYRKAGTCNWALALGIDAAAVDTNLGLLLSYNTSTMEPLRDRESKIYLFLFCVSEYYAWMNVCTAHVSWVHMELIWSQILWICRWFWDIEGMPGTKPRSHVRTALRFMYDEFSISPQRSLLLIKKENYFTYTKL